MDADKGGQLLRGVDGQFDDCGSCANSYFGQLNRCLVYVLGIMLPFLWALLFSVFAIVAF